MTRVILRVDQSTWDDIQRRVIAGGQPDRIDRGHIDMHEVVLEVEPSPRLSEATMRRRLRG